MANPRYNTQVAQPRTGTRVKRAMGGMSQARKDMADGFYKDDMGMRGGAMYKKGGKVKKKKNTKRMNRLEELGRVDSEKAYSKKGKRNLKSEKKRIVRELKSDGGKVMGRGQGRVMRKRSTTNVSMRGR